MRIGPDRFRLPDGTILITPVATGGHELRIGCWIKVGDTAHEITNLFWRFDGGRTLHLDRGALVLSLARAQTVSTFTVLTTCQPPGPVNPPPPAATTPPRPRPRRQHARTESPMRPASEPTRPAPQARPLNARVHVTGRDRTGIRLSDGRVLINPAPATVGEIHVGSWIRVDGNPCEVANMAGPITRRVLRLNGTARVVTLGLGKTVDRYTVINGPRGRG
ncbi:hypothetical protein ACFW1A_23885 [Kitasatospora sp. NPDC058965]|uniref:hypothetical protein n=1 Tax=Kitasatospora sp. NPDC058965 TaxID=3346682 RepID=UPI003692F32F